VDLWPPLGEENLRLPCGGCLGCLTDRATDWSRRSVHEARQWKHNSFLTLTYQDKDLPDDGTLVPQHLRDFFKRLRRARDRGWSAILSDARASMRYLASGEYGEHKHRPHYHVLLFNGGFADQFEVGKDLYESPALAKLWTYGQHKIGTVTGASAAYVAQYTIKKHGQIYASPDGVALEKPFIRMSRHPAIGTKWILKNKTDLSQGYLITDGKKGRIPRAYKKKLVQIDPLLAEQVVYKAQQHPRPRRNLEAAEQIHQRRAELSARRNTV